MVTKNQMTLTIYRAITVLTIAMLSACSTNVFVKGNYPSPLYKKKPFTVGVVFEEQFQNQIYTRDSIKIKMGDAQTRMFGWVLNGMFKKTTELKSHLNNTANVDLVIIPHVEEIQIATPKDNRLAVYEVWIKYKIQVFDGNENAIADWIMTAYGKTPTAALRSSAKALNMASVVALRDAGARMVSEFARVPEIQGWIVRQTSAQQSESLINDTSTTDNPTIHSEEKAQ